MIEIAGLRLYDIDELNAKLKLDKVTLRNYCRIGRIKAQKVGRSWYVTEEAIREFFGVKTEEPWRPQGPPGP